MDEDEDEDEVQWEYFTGTEEETKVKGWFLQSSVYSV